MNKTIATLEDMPAVPENADFSLAKVEKLSLPHPYCITPRHVAWASDHYGGMLSEDAICDAEKHGARCEICKVNNLNLSYHEHKTNVTLFIKVPQNTDLNAIAGLHTYLYKNKPEFEKLGIQGFAFPK